MAILDWFSLETASATPGYVLLFVLLSLAALGILLVRTIGRSYVRPSN